MIKIFNCLLQVYSNVFNNIILYWFIGNLPFLTNIIFVSNSGSTRSKTRRNTLNQTLSYQHVTVNLEIILHETSRDSKKTHSYGNFPQAFLESQKSFEQESGSDTHKPLTAT